MAKYSVITYNDGDNRTTKIAEIIEILSDYSPDLFGLQETQEIHMPMYADGLPAYGYVYFDNDGTTFNSQPIFYRKDKFELVESGIPLVTIDHVFNNRLAVVSDNVSGLEELVRYVYKKGHRKIAFLHGENTTVTRNRLTGFYRACEDLGLEIPPEYIKSCVYHDPDRCAQATRELLELPDRPTCIIFPDDFSYIGGMNVLTEAGLRIPEDISAVGYDGIHLAKVMHLTTYSQNVEQMGKIAAERLISLIEHPKTTLIDRIMVPGGLLEGTSVREI